MRSILKIRQQYLSYNNSVSNTKTIYYGVLQGSVSGSLFCLLYLNDLPIVCRHHKIVLFADDCALYLTTKTGNQRQVNTDTSNVENWFMEIKVTINKDKPANVRI